MKKETIRKGKMLSGIIVSDKMDKTVVVEVSRFVKAKKYGKYFKIDKRYKVHDPENKHKVGEKVQIRETKPISKSKHFVVVS